MAKQDRVKLVAALAILILAGLLLAWNFGLFDGAPSTASAPAPGPAAEPPPPPPATLGGQPASG